MRVHHNPGQAASDQPAFVDPTGTNNLVRVNTVSSQRMIPVGDAQTIIVRPRIPDWFKALLGLSLALNVLVILVLLIVGTRGYRWYRALSSELAPLTAGRSVPGETAALDRSPAELVGAAVGTARYSVDETLGAIREIEAATIQGQVPIDYQMPLVVQVPIDQDTVVVTNAPIPLRVPAVITLAGGGGYMNAQVALEIPAGTELPVHLGLSAPLSTTVPMRFDAPVSIPVQETDLAGPFARLRQLLEPAAERLEPDSP